MPASTAGREQSWRNALTPARSTYMFSQSILMVIAWTCLAQETDKSLPELACSFSKTTVVEGEPLIIRIELTNKTGKELMTPYGDPLVFSSASFFATIHDAHGVAAGEWLLQHSGVAATVRFLPGANVSCQKLCLPFRRIDWNKWQWLQPGDYALQCTCSWGLGQKLTAEPVRFAVSRVPDAHRSASDRLVKVHFGGWSLSDDRVPPDLDEIAHAFPASPYAPYVRFRSALAELARTPLSEGGPSLEEKTRAQSIINKCRMVLSQQPEFPMNPYLELSIVERELRLGDYGTAAERLGRLRRGPAGSDIVAHALWLSERYERRRAVSCPHSASE